MRKTNCLIWSRIDWTTVQHRATALLIARLGSTDGEFEIQRFNVEELVPPGSEGDLEVQVENISDQLLDQTIHTVPCEKIGEREYQGYNCFSTCRYDSHSGDVEVKFDNGMKPFLFGPDEKSTTYRLDEFMRLSSRYSMRIYELIKTKEASGELVLTVKELCELIGREDVPNSVGELKAEILDPAQTEIEDRCETYYTYALEEENGPRGKIRFEIRRRDGAGKGAAVGGA